jgi:aerobic carbon-monoxide dehydrogenase medium subunit
MGPAPVRARTAEGALRTVDDVEAAADAVAAESDPPSDTAGSAEYRRHLATVLARRALDEAIGR